MLKNKINLLILSIILGAILLVSMPLFYPGFFSIHDETHIVDLYEMYRGLETQGFPPRWAPDFNFGLGHPYFNFYYHLPFYITSVTMFLGFSMTTSFQIAMFIAITLACFGFFLFAQRHVSKFAAIGGAVLYIFTPYFAVDLYVRGALGELYVLALLPWAFLAINLVVTKFSLNRLVLAAVILGSIGITHNILHIFIFPIVFGYGLLLAFSHKGKARVGLLGLFLSLLLGLALASYYLIPAIAEKKYISEYEQIHLDDQFPFIKQLIIPSWGYGISQWGDLDGMSFQIGLINLLAVFSTLVLLILRKIPFKLALFFLVIFGVAVILMNSRTYHYFWNLSSFLLYFQFPWRLLIFTTLTTSILWSLVLNYLFTKFNHKRQILYFLLIIISTISITIWYFQPSQYKEVSDERYLELYFANRTLEGNGERGYLSKDYLNFAEDFIPPTKWQSKRLTQLPRQSVEVANIPYIEMGEANISYKREGINYDMAISTKEGAFINIYNSYFPGWNLYIDGKLKNIKLVPTEPSSLTGIIDFYVKPGTHMVQLKWEDTPVRSFANGISLSAAIILLLCLLKVNLNKFTLKR